jgi:uncharacterized protein (TIGR02271 family)
MNTANVERELRRIESWTTTASRKLWHKLTNRSLEPNVDTFDGSASVLDAEDIAELELLSESLHIDKEKIADGELSIRKEVITELQTIQVPVTREELVIERRTADGRSTSEVLIGQKQLRIPISRERVIVKKEPVISEVARISRRKIVETKYISSPVRHEELRVIREGDAHIAGDQENAA